MSDDKAKPHSRSQCVHVQGEWEVNENEFETNVFPQVLANEATCRLYLKKLEERGVRFSIPIDELTHEERQNAAIRIYATLKLEEKRKQL